MIAKVRSMIRTTTKPKERRGLDSDRCWAAVAARDKASDGQFYYSVATTGVYCRPSCAARLASRKNVAFHKSCKDAEAAGFRPCKRCKPNEPSLAAQYAQKVAEACRLIEAAEEAPTLDELAAEGGVRPYHFPCGVCGRTLPLSSRLQGHHRSHSEGLRRRTSSATCAYQSEKEQFRDRRHTRIRFQFQRAFLRKLRGGSRHVAEFISQRRRQLTH